MGYVHGYSLSRRPTAGDFGAFLGDVRAIVEFCSERGIELAGPDGGPVITPKGVEFCGLEEGKHRGDWLKIGIEPFADGFCKTNHRPYDLAVCMVLIAAKHRFGDSFEVDSDGNEDPEDPVWTAAKNHCRGILGIGENFQFTPEDPVDILVDRVCDRLMSLQGIDSAEKLPEDDLKLLGDLIDSLRFNSMAEGDGATA